MAIAMKVIEEEEDQLRGGWIRLRLIKGLVVYAYVM